jgi:hypothetical protein
MLCTSVVPVILEANVRGETWAQKLEISLSNIGKPHLKKKKQRNNS